LFAASVDVAAAVRLLKKPKTKTLAKKKFSIFLEGEKRHEHMFQNIKKDEKLERPRGNGQTKLRSENLRKETKCLFECKKRKLGEI